MKDQYGKEMRFFVIQDGSVIGSTDEYDEAIYMIKQRKARETYWIKSDYYIIMGEEMFPKKDEAK